MTAEVLELLSDGVDPREIELPDELPEDPRLSMVRDLLGVLYRQQYDPESEPMPAWAADWLLLGLVSWLNGASWEKGMQLQSRKGENLPKSFWVRARDRHLAEIYRLLRPEQTGVRPNERVDLLIEFLRRFEQGRYPPWVNAGGPPPEASELHKAAYKALHAAKRCGGWPKDRQRMFERLKDGALCLVADS